MGKPDSGMMKFRLALLSLILSATLIPAAVHAAPIAPAITIRRVHVTELDALRDMANEAVVRRYEV